MAIHNRNVTVWTKAAWAGAWVQQYYLRPLSAVDCVAPEVPKAEFEYRYGKIKRHGATFFATFAPPAIEDQYIKIEARGTVWWVGVVTGHVDEPHGADVTAKAGRRVYTAHGLEHLLDRMTIDRAYCDTGGASVEIDQVPTFNLKHSWNGTVLGNRSTAEVDGHWCFSIDGKRWTVQNMLDYCFDLFGPAGITWSVVGQVADLDSLQTVFDPSGMSLMEVLNALIDRRRGYAWQVVTDGTGTVTIYIFTAFAEDFHVGALVAGTDDNDYSCKVEHTASDLNQPTTGANWWYYWTLVGAHSTGTVWAVGTRYKKYWGFSGNGDLQTLSLDGDRAVKDGTAISLSRASLYDEVRVSGQRVKSVFTVSFNDGTLEAGWTQYQEAAYKAGVSAVLAGYAALKEPDQVKANDIYRDDSRFDRVYQFFRIPADWNWRANNGIGTGVAALVNPVIASDGAVSAVQANYSRLARGILKRLPLLDGVNYSAGGWPSANDADAQPQFKKILALLDDGAGHWFEADKGPDQELAGIHVEPADREMGVWIKAKKPHLMARNVWSGYEPTDVEPVYDYRSLILTVAVECDEVLAVVVQSPDYPVTESGRTLVIRVPDAELWYLAPGTVVGVDASGFVAHAADAPSVLRDDSERLRIIAGLAMQWYGVERQSFKVAWKGLEAKIAPGAMVTTLTVGAADVRTVNALVTRRTWNFIEEETMLAAGWAEIDWRRIAPVNVPGARTPKTLAKQVGTLGAHRWARANWEE